MEELGLQHPVSPLFFFWLCLEAWDQTCAPCNGIPLDRQGIPTVSA